MFSIQEVFNNAIEIPNTPVPLPLVQPRLVREDAASHEDELRYAEDERVWHAACDGKDPKVGTIAFFTVLTKFKELRAKFAEERGREDFELAKCVLGFAGSALSDDDMKAVGAKVVDIQEKCKREFCIKRNFCWDKACALAGLDKCYEMDANYTDVYFLYVQLIK